ncbi:MAG: AsmA-like C-terminal domain-containing protein [Mariprofundaceae bacterium]|nr:AsmA-like C-terminal domain-containing protein [Mariprofundaceae bacterium]
MKFSLNKILTSCRRIGMMLLLLIGLTVLTAWWFAPDINRMRPHIESLLQQELQLSELSLEGLSWYWAGYIGFKVEHCSFRTFDPIMSVQDTELTVHVSLSGLMRGELWPTRISLHGGLLSFDASNQATKSHTKAPPIHIIVDDMDVQWHYASYQGLLKAVVGDFNPASGEALLRTPDFRLTAALDAHAQLSSVNWQFDNLQWLPVEWQEFVRGKVSGQGHLKKMPKQQWQLGMQLEGRNANIDLSAGLFQLPFDQLASTWMLSFNGTGDLQVLDIPVLTWQQGKNKAVGSAYWYDGELSLQANAPHVDMPLLWSWLRPLDDTPSWLDWLAKMTDGVASDIQVSLNIPWQQPLQAPPSDWDALRYHVTAAVDDTDIHLGLGDDRLSHGQAIIDLNELGLKADVRSIQLPHGVGTGAGKLNISWETLTLEVQAHGQTDVAKLLQWVNPSPAQNLHWKKAPATTKLRLTWNLLEDLPSLAHISLIPSATWHLNPNDMIPIQVQSGEVIWDMQDGLSVQDLAVQSGMLDALLSFHAAESALQGLQLQTLEAHIEANFADLLAYYHIPIEQPTGLLQADIHFDDDWQGILNFKKAGWGNFLGSSKKSNQAMQIDVQGELDNGVLKLHKLFCDQSPIQLSGSGLLSKQGLKLNLLSLKAPAFNGALKVTAPFTKEPWEMDINATYLNRQALPKQLPNTKVIEDKPWALRANIDTFIWDDARMTDVSMKLASKHNSTGFFKARDIHSGTLSLHDVSALFALPGAGMVDLRQLSANMGKQHLLLSASLRPEKGGGMHWRGFAQLDGNFGSTMQQAKLSALFEGGEMQALFLGQGVLLRNQPWWEGLDGRLRLRVDNGTLLKGGTLTKTLAAISLVDLPALIFGRRKDLTQKGLYYKRLQIEASLENQIFHIHKLGLRSSAMDIAGEGTLDLEKNNIDLKMVVQPFQNMDALLGKIPLLRDLLGGAAHSFIRKIYHMHGSISDAEVNQITPKEAGLSRPGLIEGLLNLPNLWFGDMPKEKKP